MTPARLTLRVNKEDTDMVAVICRLFDISPMEEKVIRALRNYDDTVAASTEARKYVAEELGFGNPGTLNVYIKTLKDKEVIYKKEGDKHYSYHPCFIAKVDSMDQLLLVLE